jgi:hypothetical protein
MSTKYADIRLFYYKQGDDLSACIVHNADGTINVKESIKRHIGLLQASINKLQSIHDAIPDNNMCKLDADTHHIGIYGDDQVVQTLIDQELAYLKEFDDEESPNSSNSWVTDWQKTCAEYEQWYIDAFSQNPKNKN